MEWNRNVTFKIPNIKGAPRENICMTRKLGTD